MDCQRVHQYSAEAPFPCSQGNVSEQAVSSPGSLYLRRGVIESVSTRGDAHRRSYESISLFYCADHSSSG